jgi:hypothetical protein
LAADDGACEAGGVVLAIGVALEVAEGERRFVPAVEAEGCSVVLGGFHEERFVDGHVTGAGSGRIDD